MSGTPEDFDFDGWLDEHDFEMVDDFQVVNGADRMIDGTFGMLPQRIFRADGRTPMTLDGCYRLARDIRALCGGATCGRPFEALEAVAEMRRLVDELEHEVVALARSYHWSWRDVADALGVSRTSAHRRFAQWEVYHRRRRPAP